MADSRGVKPPVIADVARVAGVSVPTVSRVLNGSVPVSAERRDRVLAAVKELGFRPNGAARALANRGQPMIAVFAGNTTRYGYASTLQGIEEAARQAGYMVVISVVESARPEIAEQAIDHALRQPLAGAVVLEFDPPGAAALRAVPAWLPKVAAAAGSSSGGESVPHAYMDDRLGAYRATQYLLDLGHRTVHHVSIPSVGTESARLVGWREALTEAGAPVPPVIGADWSPMSGYDAGSRLAADDEVTAVLAGNDELAMGIVKALGDQGRRVPDDVSVVGFDDHPLSGLWSPPLTTVRQDFVALGRRVVGLLLDQLAPGTTASSVRMVPDLVVRASTGRVEAAVHTAS
ncbi:LacI family DNA-binding transcriptional regulator [Isoptericola haloaureus]|uniref:LacI family DNA-binding transcriptional regulator n=1 Tax=Isoptericola haloaureus TaxID=1542902 RepID=A0ABU7Z814_9MICO